jgi:hypothetical protein
MIIYSAHAHWQTINQMLLNRTLPDRGRYDAMNEKSVLADFTDKAQRKIHEQTLAAKLPTGSAR